ncbi:hypothetical protein [Pseudomonas oryzihabitans]|uniref:hypothetical protein n=1 Tax=Pseudomonas oryzihabitans TaxID=47885 RepID=UPI00119CC090|nr:hypothetical protein [Pseudomonas psychrotolerans]
MGVSNETVQAVERMLTTLRGERDDYRELAHQWRAMCFELVQENQALRDRLQEPPRPMGPTVRT